MNRRALLASAPIALLGGCASAQPRMDNAATAKQLSETELAFAKTMADRDHAAHRMGDDRDVFTPALRKLVQLGHELVGGLTNIEAPVVCE